MAKRNKEQISRDLRSQSEDLISLANSRVIELLNSETCPLALATMALVLEKRRTADALDRIATKIDDITVDGKIPVIPMGGMIGRTGE